MKARSTWSVALLALTLGSSVASWPGSAEARWFGRAVVPAGTTMSVRIEDKLSTDDNHDGDTWSGTVTRSVVNGGRAVIPAGSRVTGVVTQAHQGTHDTKAQLGLAVREVTVGDESYQVSADTPPIVAGSKRAKKIGAIAGGAVVGGLLGHAVGGDKGTLIGGALGGAAGYGLTRHAFRTLQIKPGTVVQFTMHEQLVARR